jgi:hypothetical protein
MSDDYYDDYCDNDICYECSAYGNDYFINEDGELECRCSECTFNPNRRDDWDD